MKQNNFHKKHINKWLIFVLCMAFTLQLFAVPMLALAENMENAPGQETPAAGEVLPEPSASASSGANDSPTPSGDAILPSDNNGESNPAGAAETPEASQSPAPTETNGTVPSGQPRDIKTVFEQLASQGIEAYSNPATHTVLSDLKVSFLSADLKTVLEGENISPDSIVRFTFDVTIPAEIATQLISGDYYSFHLPDTLSPIVKTVPIQQSQTGVSFGKADILQNGTVRITAGDYFAHAENTAVVGTFSFDAAFNMDQIALSTPFEISIGGENFAPVPVLIADTSNEESASQEDYPVIVPMAAPIGTDIKNYFTTTPATIISGMHLSYTDAQGNPMPDGTANINSQIKFNFDLAIPNDVTPKIKAGDFYTIELPDNVKIKTGLYNQPMIDPVSGKTYANFSVNTDGTVTITFTDAISTLRDVTGQINFNGAFNSLNVTEPGDTDISIPSETNVSSSVTLKPLVGSAIEKKGAFDKMRNPDSITWDVIINKNMDSLSNAKVADTLPPGLIYSATTVEVLPVNLDVYGNITSYGAPLTSGYTVSDTTTKNDTVTFDAPIKTAYCIRYTTPIDKSVVAPLGENKLFENNATLDWSGNTTPLSAQATLRANYDSYLKKMSTGYSPQTQTVKWMIQYNYAGNTIPAGTMIADIYNNIGNTVPMSFDPATLKIYPVTFDGNGNPVQSNQPLASSEYSLTENADPGNRFEITFTNGLTGAYNIVYETKAEQAPGNIVNTDQMIANATQGTPPGGSTPITSTPTFTLRQQGAIKTVKDVDYSSPVNGKTITWQVVLNNDHKTITKGLLTDMANYIIDGQVTDCSVVDNGSDGKGNTLLGNDKYSYTNLPAGFKLELDASLFPTDHSFTITFKTPLKYTGQDPSLTTYKNTAFFEDGLGIYTSEAQVSLNKQTQQNGGKSGSYNAVTKQITWSIYTNYAKTGLQNARIDDPIPDDQVFVPGSTRIYFYSVSPDGGYTQLRELTPEEYGYFMISEPANPSGTDKTLTVRLPDAAPDAVKGVPVASSELPPLFLVQFDTTVEGTVVKKEYTNEADFYNDFTPKETLTSKVAVNNGGSLAYKNGYQGADGYAYWNVTINPSQSTLTDTKVVDVPSSNQSILMSSLTINGMQVDQSGKLTPDLGVTLVQGTDYDAAYTNVNGTWTLTVTLKGQYATIDRAYYMSYKAAIYVDPSNGSATQQITNTATITGNNGGSHSGSVTTPLGVDVNRGGGTLRGAFQKLTIQKVDMDGNPLAGAQFQLYDKNGDPVGGITTSDAQGIITYENLVSGDYTIQEVAVPPGYTLTTVLSSGVPISLSPDNNIFTFTNGLTQVEFVKENEIGWPVSGATFAIEQQVADGWQTVRENLTTDSAGQILVKGLSVGHYRFVETRRADEYILNTTPMEFDVTTNPDVIKVGSFIDYQGSFRMVKGSDTGQPLEGVVFELYKMGDTPSLIAELTTDSSGWIGLGGLSPGSYKLVETKTLDGLVLDERPIFFSITDSYAGAFPTLDLQKFINHQYKGNLEISKTDLQGAPLAEAVFSVYSSNGNLILDHITTDKSGKAVVTGLLPGEYYFVETKAPDGYILDEEKHLFSVVYDAKGQHISVEQTVTNTPLSPDALTTSRPQTGDNSSLGLWIALCLAAGTTTVVLLRYKYKKQHEK